MAAWSRAAAAADGVPQVATTWTAPAAVSDVPLRDFTGRGEHPTPGGDGPPPPVCRDRLLLIGSDDDTPVGWLRTGRALALVLLTLTDAGLVTQPLGPITDVPATRVRLQRQLGLLGHPQLLFRAGYGYGRPRAGRRSVDDLLTITA
jgi:hypothetical protein